MNKYEIRRKISYLKLSAHYYELLCKKEIEFDCLNQNFENAKALSKSYFTEEGHDKENDRIYNFEIVTLKFCLKNLNECKKLDKEIEDTKIKLLKACKKMH